MLQGLISDGEQDADGWGILHDMQGLSSATEPLRELIYNYHDNKSSFVNSDAMSGKLTRMSLDKPAVSMSCTE